MADAWEKKFEEQSPPSGDLGQANQWYEGLRERWKNDVRACILADRAERAVNVSKPCTCSVNVSKAAESAVEIILDRISVWGFVSTWGNRGKVQELARIIEESMGVQKSPTFINSEQAPDLNRMADRIHATYTNPKWKNWTAQQKVEYVLGILREEMGEKVCEGGFVDKWSPELIMWKCGNRHFEIDGPHNYCPNCGGRIIDRKDG